MKHADRLTTLETTAASLPQVLVATADVSRTQARCGRERLASVTDGTRTWELGDALGSVQATLDNSGGLMGTASYDPWGVPDGAPRTPWGFSGELQDPQFGLVNLCTRWYDTNSGTFLTKDPYPGVPTRPFSQHPYAYAHANPVNSTNPTGKCIDERVPGIDEPGCRVEEGVLNRHNSRLPCAVATCQAALRKARFI